MTKLATFIFLCIPLHCFPQNSAAYRDSLTSLTATSKKDTSLVNTLNKLADWYSKEKPDSLVVITKQAMDLATKLNYAVGAGDAGMLLSKYNRNRGDFPFALKTGLQALHEYEAAKAVSAAAFAQLEIAQIYKDMTGQHQTEAYINTGINYSKEAYASFKSIADSGGMVLSLNMSGILFRDKGKTFGDYYYDTALSLYNSAFDIIKRSGKGKEYTGKLYNNISQVYTEHKKDYHTALRYLMKAVDFNTAANKVSSLSYNYGNISKAYTELNDHANSLKYARLMLQATLKEGAPARVQNAYHQLYTSFEGSGQMDSALRYYILADNIDDSLANLAKTQQVMNLQVQYETAKKETEIARLGKEGALQTKRTGILLLVLVIIAASAFTMLWLYRRVNKQKQQIALQSHRLEVVMKELHHRVKNNLQIVSSLLSLQTYKLHDEETISVLKESQQRVQAMSLIHQRLYTKDSLTSINMKEYITDLAESLLSSYGFGNKDFELNIKIDIDLLDVEKALPIGLMINEMVTNALKYAYKNTTIPSLTIRLTPNGEELELVVKDNGPGINLTEWKMKGSSFGKQLITALGKQLRAQQTIAVENGTRFTITIPNKAA